LCGQQPPQTHASQSPTFALPSHRPSPAPAPAVQKPEAQDADEDADSQKSAPHPTAPAAPHVPGQGR